MRRRYFGTDGIRGKSNIFPITPDIMMRVGIAVGHLFRNAGKRPRVIIGKDTRLSGYMIENALVAGFTSAGVDAFMLGPIPSPAVAMLTISIRADVGVMISASHNPYQDNGIKLFGPDGYKVSTDIEDSIECIIEKDCLSHLSCCNSIGQVKRINGVHDRYIEYAKRTLPRDVTLRGLRIVVDCANGASYKVAPAVLWELGADVIVIGDKPNGLNINLDCGSTNLLALQKKVHEVRADIGIALDGDGDRVIIVDELGSVVNGDQIMALIAREWMNISSLNGGGIVTTIMSNIGLEIFLSDIGLSLKRTKVGDRYVVEYMRNNGFNVGGEQSGHIILSDYCSTGDGLVAALQVLRCIKKYDQPVSRVCHCFEEYPQFLRSIEVKDSSVLNNALVVQAISDAEAELQGMGRLVVRASGTESMIRVMAEGDDLSKVKRIVDDLVSVIQ
ncbi:phosphoglucosamine mutase [Candidatus Liberibacter americanus]|uniref:Phosphoglucosamine mutase n=1 Tax=Candidatus Liberibacter americanus str. Sao Paulo TaxID=1261131 RepID=U6B5H9_9HYPH|nr:phosphoglucosamine mutase [Candidatus Liberibacter americanus]AHA28235.1 Phosphomannomutase [Candidatus Liberibacter americanus str. Sao Paulo]EMS36251.1 phosphoglucosamine mutase protein [Candidatus Liberibacter americanus PW_SP]